MTIAISLKINDGLVLATDSATTVFGPVKPGQLGVVNVYTNANKLFNLRKGLPIGAIVWGAGSIGTSSISTLMKDVRERFSIKDNPSGWYLTKDNYTMKEVADKVKKFIFEENYEDAFKTFPQKPPLGLVIAGYSPKSPMAEEYQIDIVNGQCSEPRILRGPKEVGFSWSGDPEAINRLILGSSPGIWPVLKNSLGLDDAKLKAAQTATSTLNIPVLHAAMPLQDAIDLAEFLVQTTIGFSRFKPGAPTVGGPIELAAISKHEGFRWIKRKYYFDRNLNPDANFTRTFEPEPDR